MGQFRYYPRCEKHKLAVCKIRQQQTPSVTHVSWTRTHDGNSGKAAYTSHPGADEMMIELPMICTCSRDGFEQAEARCMRSVVGLSVST
jgi:hypothetical protein